MQKQRESPVDPVGPDQFEEDCWYYDKDVDELYVVRESTIQHEADEGFVGEMTIEPLDGGLATHDAEQVAEWTRDERVFGVPQRVAMEPEQIVLEYARQQIREDARVIGMAHDYDGVDGVEEVRHLVLALNQLDV